MSVEFPVTSAETVNRHLASRSRKEEMADQNMGQTPKDVEAGQCPEWKNTADHSPVVNSSNGRWHATVPLAVS